MNNQFRIKRKEETDLIDKEKHLLLLKLKELSDKAISIDEIKNNNFKKDTDVMGVKFENEDNTIIHFWRGINPEKFKLQVSDFSYLFCRIENDKAYLHNILNDIFHLDRNIQINVIKMLAQVMNIKMLDCVKNIVWVESPIVINNEELELKLDDEPFIYTCEISINNSEKNRFSKPQEDELTKLIEKAGDYGFRFINLNLLDKYQYPTDLTITIAKYHGFLIKGQSIIAVLSNKICVGDISQNETLEGKANRGYLYDAQSKINNDIPELVKYVLDKYTNENSLLPSKGIKSRNEFLQIMSEIYDKIDLCNKDNDEKAIQHYNQMVESISLFVEQYSDQVVI